MNYKKAILAIDSCTKNLSVCMFKEQKVMAKISYLGEKHSEKAIFLIKQVLNESSMNLKQIESIIYTNGPGNFTGVRMCQSLAQTIAFGLNIPIISISTLELLAHTAFAEDKNLDEVICTLDARMNEAYFAKYIKISDKIKLAEPEKLINTNKIEQAMLLIGNTMVTGNGFDENEQIRQIQPKHNHNKIYLPNIEYAINVVKNSEKDITERQVKPHYIRNKVAKYKKGV